MKKHSAWHVYRPQSKRNEEEKRGRHLTENRASSDYHLPLDHFSKASIDARINAAINQLNQRK